MRVFSVPIEMGDPEGGHFKRLDALVDTGATFTMVPASLLDELGVEPEESMTFELADGTPQDFGLGETRVRVAGREISTVVLFGGEDATPLLGAYTLERLMLTVDPGNQRLIRARGHI